MNNLTKPAYPVVPLQDNFHRLIVPIPGLSKLEHFALEIFKAQITNNLEHSNTTLMELAILDAITLLKKIEETTKTIDNDKSTEMAIFDR